MRAGSSGEREREEGKEEQRRRGWSVGKRIRETSGGEKSKGEVF